MAEEQAIQLAYFPVGLAELKLLFCLAEATAFTGGLFCLDLSKRRLVKPEVVATQPFFFAKQSFYSLPRLLDLI